MQSKKILFLFSESVCHLAFVGLVPLDLNFLLVSLLRRTPRLQQSERLSSSAALLCVAAPGGHAATSTPSTHGGRHRLTQPHLRRGVRDSLTQADWLGHASGQTKNADALIFFHHLGAPACRRSNVCLNYLSL